MHDNGGGRLSGGNDGLARHTAESVDFPKRTRGRDSDSKTEPASRTYFLPRLV
jgi:hypothetical protein